MVAHLFLDEESVSRVDKIIVWAPAWDSNVRGGYDWEVFEVSI